MVGNAKIVKVSMDKQTHDEHREVRKMRIRTVYSFEGRKVLETKSFYACNALPNASRKMQYNDFGADLVEVYSIETGKVYLIMTRDVVGDLHTHLKEIIKPGE